MSLFLLAAWSFLVAAILFLSWKRIVVYGPICLSYFFLLSLIHVPGLLATKSIWCSDYERSVTEKGFLITVVGMAFFVMGSMTRLRKSSISSCNVKADQKKTGFVFIGLGLFCNLVLVPVSSLLPSLTSVLGQITGLIVVGYWIIILPNLESGNFKQTLKYISILPLFPIATMVHSGFINFGLAWSICCLVPYVLFFRPRWIVLLFLPVVAFIGLSFSTAYLGARTDLREVTWYERGNLSQRLDKVLFMVNQMGLLDLHNKDHFTSINERLNQNLLVGIAAERLDSGVIEMELGSTVQLWILVPRFMWPGKPNVGGGGTVVSNATGLTFGELTSVGAGSILESFINFGTFGVCLVLGLLGYILGMVDVKIREGISSLRDHDVIKWSLIGLALLQPGGNFNEVIVAVVGAFVAAELVLVARRVWRKI